MSDSCDVTFDIAHDRLYCDLAAGHAGPHKDRSMEDANVWWQKEITRKRHE